MVFSTPIFLFYFLVLTLLVYYLVPRKLRNGVLLISSLFFYYWGEQLYVSIMFLSTAIDYVHGLLVERCKARGNDRGRADGSGLLYRVQPGPAAVLQVLGLPGRLPPGGGLNFMPVLNIHLPIGISFYTFQTMSYTIDVYRGHVRPQRNLATFATFVCLFPQLIAGPIVRYSDIEAELHTRRFCLEDIGTGARRFTVVWAKRSCLPMCWASWCPPPGTQRCSARGSGPWVICCRFILTFLATATWPSASGGCSASRSRRISTIRILPAP